MNQKETFLLACETGDADTAAQLLHAGCRNDCDVLEGMFRACKGSHTSVLDVLEDAALCTYDITGTLATACWLAVCRGDRAVVRWFLGTKFKHTALQAVTSARCPRGMVQWMCTQPVEWDEKPALSVYQVLRERGDTEAAKALKASCPNLDQSWTPECANDADIAALEPFLVS